MSKRSKKRINQAKSTRVGIVFDLPVALKDRVFEFSAGTGFGKDAVVCAGLRMFFARMDYKDPARIGWDDLLAPESRREVGFLADIRRIIARKQAERATWQPTQQDEQSGVRSRSRSHKELPR
jgi:hypothetical protein